MPRVSKESAAIGELTQKVNAIGDSVAKLADVVTNITRAQPVARSGMIDTGDLPQPAEAVVVLPSTGEARLEGGEIEPVEGPKPKEFLDELAFNEEFVTVRLSEDPSPNAEATVSTWVNGRHQLFIRGQEQTVRRKFVEALLRAKPVSFSSEEYTDAQGVRQFRYPKRAAPKYPLQMIRDDNPRGRDWLRKIVAEPA